MIATGKIHKYELRGDALSRGSLDRAAPVGAA
jgi:hypothetical protein